MGSIAVMYCKQVKRDSRLYFGQWMPNSRMELGTIGKREDGVLFVPKTSLSRQGIAFEVEEDEFSSPLDLQSSSGVRISTKLAGEVSADAPSIPKASAGVVVEFGRQAAYVIKAERSYEPRIADVAALETEILQRVKKKEWDPQWVVISQLVFTPMVSILISETKNARLEITAEGNATLGQQVKLGDAGFEFRITSESGKYYNFLNSEAVTPLFQLVGLRRRPLRTTKVGTLKYAPAPTSVAALDADEIAASEEIQSSLYVDVLGYSA